jgi:hypothetical protein
MGISTEHTKSGGGVRRGRRRRRLALSAALAAVGLGFGANAAQAAFSPDFSMFVFTSEVQVGGQVEVFARVSNLNSQPDYLQPNVVCNAGDPAPCPAGGDGFVVTSSVLDPGVFSLPTGAFTTIGPACPSSFTATTVDAATKTVSFTPAGGGNFTLTNASVWTQCPVRYHVTVLAMPTVDADLSTPGMQVRFSGSLTQVLGSLTPGQPASTLASGGTITVVPASPSIGATASADVPLGGTLTDSATVTDRVSASGSGSVTFHAYGPDDPTCAGPAAFSDTRPLPAADGPVTSAAFSPTATGTYRWIASYSGDANNAASSTACGDAGQQAVVSKATPGLSTSITPAGAKTTATEVTPHFTLSGAQSATPAPLQYVIYGPDDPTCAGPAASAATTITSIGATGGTVDGAPGALPAGTWTFVPDFAGDANNAAVTGSCADAAARITVDRQPTTTSALSTAGAIKVGEPTTATATVAGRAQATGTGTVSFALYGPGDPTCTGTPVSTTTSPYTAADAPVTSTASTPTLPGTYLWVARYAGDANNLASASTCAAAGSVVVVSKATPALTVAASPDVNVGEGLSATATVTGRAGGASGGTVDFRLYGPDDPSCAGPPVFSSLGRPVGQDGTATSQTFTPTAPGSYLWVASSATDASNAAATSACGGAGPRTTVKVPATTIPLAPPSSAAGAPAPPPAPVLCRSTRKLSIGITLAAPRGIKLARTVVRINGKVKHILGRGVTRFTLPLTGYATGRAFVILTARTTKGTTLVGTRTYRLCGYRAKPEKSLTPLRPRRS